MRLAGLYLRSRLTGRALALLALLAAATAAWLRHDAAVATLLSVMVSLAVATVIGTSARSPFGEVERSAGTALAALRCGHLAGLLALAVAALALAAIGAGADSWRFVRNVAGFTGLALLPAPALGAGVSWVVPFAFVGYIGAVVFTGGMPGRWAWPLHPAADRPAATIALALLLLGLTVVARLGAREGAGEVE